MITIREKTFDEKANEIELKYQPELDRYSKLIITAISADGTNQSAKVASFQTKYLEIIGKKNLELEALYE